MSFPTALDHMAVLVLLGFRTSSHGIQHCRQLWEKSFARRGEISVLSLRAVNKMGCYATDY